MTPRRLALIAGALILLAAVTACVTSSSTGLHWRRSSGTQTLVVLQPSGGTGAYTTWLTITAADWSRSTRLAVRVRTCQPGENCVPVYGITMSGGEALVGADGLHILTGSATWIHLDSTPNSEALNLLCHEVGHILGEGHGYLPGPCQGGHPTAWDLALIDRAYNHVDATGPAGV